jgi:phosphate transport system substrate-binding protein
MKTIPTTMAISPLAQLKRHSVRWSFWLLASAVYLATPPLVQAQNVRLHGALTLSKFITEQQAAVETDSGLKMEVIGNGSGRGLSDLASGQADIALLAGSLPGVASALNKEKPGSVNIDGLQGVSLFSVKLLLVVNPAAGVKSVTAAQARDIFTGKVVNWKDVGGADQPVKVVLPVPGDGARVAAQEQLLNGVDFAANAIVRNSSKDIAPVIGQLPGSVSFLSEKNVAGLGVLTCDKELQMPLLLVTKGEPAGDVKKIVEALKRIIK